MNNPKKHHFVPESYLSGFTLTGKKKDKFWVIDKLNETVRRSTPQNEAHKRYLYKVKVEKGDDEFAIEKSFSKFENDAIPVLKEIDEKHSIPCGEQYDLLINYLALQIVRTPKFRDDLEKMLSNFYNQVGKLCLQMILQSKEYFDNYIDEMIRHKPYLCKEQFNYGRLCDVVKNRNIKAVIDNNYHVENSLKTINVLLPCLGNRNWCVLSPMDNRQYFIASDNPVVLIWSNHRNFNSPLGYGLRGTDVIFPINKKIAILGRFEPQPIQVLLDFQNVAKLNNYIANSSVRYLYSCEKEPTFYVPDKKS